MTREIVAGPGSTVLRSSRRSDDYELTLNQDVSIGYRTHAADDVELYLEGSVTFLVRDDQVAVSLHYS